MIVRGQVQQILIKDGKDHDIRFSLGLDDEDVVQLLRWRRQGLILHIEPVVQQLELPGDEDLGTFTINGEVFPIRPANTSLGYQLTGLELRDLVGQAGEEVCLHHLFEAPEDGSTVVDDPGYELVPDDQLFVLTPGAVFTTHVGPEEEPAAEGDEGMGPSDTFPPHPSESTAVRPGAIEEPSLLAPL